MKQFAKAVPLFVLILLGSILTCFAQSPYRITGTVKDGDSSLVLGNATISIASKTDTTRKRSLSADVKGNFSIAVGDGEYVVEFSFTGYDLSKKNVKVSGADIDLGEVLMFRKQKTLGDVVVVGKVPPARQKGDTTEINAAALKVNPDATVEDLVKKAPGITVENGQVMAQGEAVQKVTIDGREYFGSDATAALKNLPAEIVDKIQVFDRMSDQAQLTGVSDGNEVKALNIVTKANMRNGQFGRIYAGYGTDDRYAAGGNVNIFKKDTRINILGLFNNVNQQNFGAEDLLGVNGQANQGGQRGGGGGGGGRGGGGFGGGGGNFSTQQQAGIATTNAFGINFSDLWLKKKMTVTGSYFFNNSTTKALSQTNRETFLGDTSQFYSERNQSTTENFNHRLNARFEYKIDSNNTLIYSPNFSFQTNKRNSLVEGLNKTSNDEIINATLNSRLNNSEGFNIRNELTFRHGFAKRGRSISINLNSQLNDRDVNSKLNSATSSRKTLGLVTDTIRQQTDNESDGSNWSTNLTYTEPLGKNGMLQVNYNPQIIKSHADQRNVLFDEATGDYTKFDTAQSNLFDNTTSIQNAGLNYRISKRDKGEFSVGINYQQTDLESQQTFPFKGSINKSFNNWLPNINWRKDFNKQTNLRMRYRASVNTPSVNQLQNVINISNPLFLTSGNPNLGQSFTNFLFARFGTTNAPKAKSFFAGIFAQQVNDYITNGTWVASKDSTIQNGILLRQGAQFSKPVNLSGYWSVRSFANYGFPIRPIKSNLNLSGGVGYVRTPGMVNNITNFTNNYNFTAGLTLSSNISEYIDYTLSYNGNFNNAVNSFNPDLDNKFYSHNVSAKLNLLTKNGWFVLNDIGNQIYSGLADGFNQNFWLWNVSTGKKFLAKQRGELKVTVFDLLKQNQSVTRTVDALYIEDVQTVVLQQYFMLTFTYTLRNFGKASPSPRAGMGGNPDFRGR